MFKEYNNELEKFPGYPFKNKMKIIFETALGVMQGTDNKEDKFLKRKSNIMRRRKLRKI